MKVLSESEVLELARLEKIRAAKVAELLSKVSLGQELNDAAKIDLRNDVKFEDLTDRILLVKKGGAKMQATYSNHIFEFLTLGLTTSSKRMPLQLIALNHGSCLNYLKSLGFEQDFESSKSDYTRAINAFSSKLATTNTEQQLSDILVNSKFNTKLYSKALRAYDVNSYLATNVSRGLVSPKTLAIIEEAKAREAKREAEKLAKAEFLAAEKLAKVAEAKAAREAKKQAKKAKKTA